MTSKPRAADNVIKALLDESIGGVDTDAFASDLLAGLAETWVDTLTSEGALLYEGTLLRFTGDGQRPSARLRLACLLGFNVTVKHLPVPSSAGDEPSIETPRGGRIWMATDAHGAPVLRPGEGGAYIHAEGTRVFDETDMPQAENAGVPQAA